MKDKLTFALMFLVGFVLGLALLTDDARAQTTQSPPDTPGQVGPYNVISSIELGVRGIAINGNADKYRSDLNYTPGFRIFDSSLLMESSTGEGLLFDKLMVSSFGWGIGGGDHRGGDPTRALRVNAEKNAIYTFDANYRRFDYFNSLRNFALNQHISNTEYRQGDFDLTILPNNKHVRVNLGYSLNRNTGPSLTTWDYSRDEFPVLSPVRVSSDEYRVGFDSRLWFFDLSFLQGWRTFKEDSTYFIDQPNVGNNPTIHPTPPNLTVMDTFHRDLPTRGTSPYTRFSLHTMIAKRVDFTGRYIYSSGNTDYTLNELITGRDASGNNIKSDTTLITGSVKRPHGMGDIGATVFVTDRIRLSETFRVDNFRINGGQQLLEELVRTRNTAAGEVPLATVFTDRFFFRTTNYRRYLNLFEGDFDIARWLTVHIGHRFTDRHIELGVNDFVTGTEPEPELEKFDNQTNALIFGFKARPHRIWSLYFDIDHGSADNVFTRVDNYDFTNIRVRSILRPTKTLTINGSLVTRDNNNPSETRENPPRQFGTDSNARTFTGSVDWMPSEKFSLASGYTHAHVVTEASIIFTAAGIQTFGLSRYFMRDNFAFINLFVEPHPRLQIYGGYRIHNDPGQGDRESTPEVLIGSFPYQFQSPEVKFKVKLHQRLDWIAGYQYFDYQEHFPNLQRYEAHLPYTSLRFYFGQRR